MVTRVSKCSLPQRSCVHAKRYWPATRSACCSTLAPCDISFPGKAPTADTPLRLSSIDQHQLISLVCDLLVLICTINVQEERFNAGSTTCGCVLWKPGTPTGNASHGLFVRSRPDIRGTSSRLRGVRRGPAPRSRTQPEARRHAQVGRARQLDALRSASDGHHRQHGPASPHVRPPGPGRPVQLGQGDSRPGEKLDRSRRMG